MRSHLSVITTLWIVVGLITFPMLYLMLGFANDNPNAQTRIISGYLILFYLQLIIQSFVAAASLKYIRLLKQYRFAVLTILLAPLLLLICVPIGFYLSSNQFLLASFFVVLTMQLIGSIWMWILIANREKAVIVLPERQQTIARPSEADLATSEPSDRINETRSRNKVAHILLKLPIGIFALIAILTLIISIIGAVFPGIALSQSSFFKFIFTSLGTLFALSVITCLTAGIYLLLRKGK